MQKSILKIILFQDYLPVDREFCNYDMGSLSKVYLFGYIPVEAAT